MNKKIAGLGCLYILACVGQLLFYVGMIWLVVTIVKHVWFS